MAGKFGTMLMLLLGAAPVFAQAQQQTSPPAQTDQKAAPAKPAAKKPSTADENPFPEEQSRKAAQADDAAPAAPPKSTTPDESDSSSRAKFQGIPDMTDDNASRISNGAGGYIVNPKLAVEDVRVGGFYLDRHDYKGAYARFKEATLVDPGNADAVFGLAEAARGLNHKDEAVASYRVYLDAVPDSKKAKEARKALAALGEPAEPEK
jgi:tetratricopeptide (TPR) repeat protein